MRIIRPSIVVLALLVSLGGSVSGQSIYREINDSQLFSSGPFEITANGSVSMVPANIQICSNLIDPGCLATLDVQIQTSVNVALEVKASVSGSFQKEWPGSITPLPPITAGGYTVTPYLYVSVGVVGTMDAGVVASVVQQWGIGANFSMGGGAGFTGSTDPLDRVLQVDGPVVTAGSFASLEVFVHAALYFDVWTAGGFPIGGPLLLIRPSATMTVQPAQNPWWTLTGANYSSVGWFFWGVGVPWPLTLTNDTFNITDAGTGLGNLATLAESRWAKTYEIAGSSVSGSSVAVTQGGDFLVAGNGDGILNRQLLLELDGPGGVIHENRTDIGSPGRPRSVIETSDGGVVLAGTTSTTSAAYLAKYDSNRAFLWKKTLMGSSTAINEVIELSNGDLLCTGISGAPLNPWVVRLDSSGNVLWAKEYQTPVVPTGPVGEGHDVVEMSNGNIAMIGNIEFTDTPGNVATMTITSQNAFVVMMDGSGNEIWSKVVGNTGYAGATSGCEADNGDLIIAGDSSLETLSAWICRLDPTGALVWSNVYSGESSGTAITSPGNTQYDVITDIERTDAGFVATGITSIGADQDAWLLKIDNEGRIVWFKSFRGDNADQLFDLEIIDDKLIVAVGTTKTFSGGTEQLLMVRTSVDGMLHFQETGGVQLMDVHNDHIERADTPTYVIMDIGGSLINVTPTEVSETMASQAPGVTSTLRTL